MNNLNASDPITNPIKRVSIKISSNGSDYIYAKATLTVIGLYILIFILTITFSVLEFRYKTSEFDLDTLKERFDEKMKTLKENLGMEEVGAYSYIS